jgi:hypothetical protein
MHAQQLAMENFPKLRENVWHIAENANPDDPTYLITVSGQYELPAIYAKNFLKIRPFCTGHHSIKSISAKTDVSIEEIFAFINIFSDIGLLSCEASPQACLDSAKVRETLMQIVKIWANELHSVYIANELALEGHSKTVLVGWLLEMYHYVRDFPAALRVGADRAQGELKDILSRYASEEESHEEFVLQTLINLGLKEAEVKASAPLVSTRCIGLLLRELLEFEPEATLLAAALLEAADFDEENIMNYKKRLSLLYDIPDNALDPYFAHQKIDYELGHQRLLVDNLDSIRITDLQRLDETVNKLHDLKHAFELQSLEIKSYYGEPLNGRYIPRQQMLYMSV